MNKNIFKWVIFGGLFIIPFVPFLVSGSLFFPFITTKGFAFRIIVEIIFFSWIILASISPEYRLKKSIILYSLLSFIFIIGLADAFGVAPVKSFWSNFERMEGFITLLHLGALFVVIGSVFKFEEWKWWWNTTLVASFLMVLYCLMQLACAPGGCVSGQTVSFDIHQGGVRVDGTLGNATYLAVYMLFHIFIGLLMLIKEKHNTALKWIYSMLILGQTFILYQTATRGAILGLIGGVLLVAILNVKNKESKRIRKASISTIIGIIILVIGFIAIKDTSLVKNSPVLSRFATISSEQIKTEGRSFVWPMAIQGIKERPLLGWGQENFNYVFNKQYDPKMYKIEPWFDRAHNIFLDWGVAGGLLGLIGYLSLYLTFLYSIWKKDVNLTYLEKSVFTGLLAAYFFHNLFVFDHLLSYILFISILAFVHSRTINLDHKLNEAKNDDKKLGLVFIPSVIGLVVVLYFINIKPIIANTNLIKGLQVAQTNTPDKSSVLTYLRKSYNASRLGRPEVVEWISTSAQNVIGSDSTPEVKNEYFNFAKEKIEKQANEFNTDARYQLLAGSFFSQTNNPDDAIKYLNRALELTPGKQITYFEIGSVLISKKDYKGALEVFKKAYDLEPKYKEAGLIYLIGAIYAGNAEVVDMLSKTLDEQDIINDSRIASALFATNRLQELEGLLIRKIKSNPENPEGYTSLAAVYLKQGNKNKAIETLNALAVSVPEQKDQVEQYIKGIQDGTIK